MPQEDQLAKEAKRTAGEAQKPEDKVPTYQEMLDGALEDTFPASDPIAPGGATKVVEPHTTARDAMDWKLHPRAEGQDTERAAAPARPAAPVSAPYNVEVVRPIKVWTDGDLSVEVPAGRCVVRQSEERAFIAWTEDPAGSVGPAADGAGPVGSSKSSRSEHSGWIALERYRELLAGGDLRREGDIAST